MPVYHSTNVDSPIITSSGAPIETHSAVTTGHELGSASALAGSGYTHETVVQHGEGRKRKHTRKHKKYPRNGRKPRSHKHKKHSRKTKMHHSRKHKSKHHSKHHTRRHRRHHQSGHGYGFAPLEGDFVGSQGAGRAISVPYTNCGTQASP